MCAASHASTSRPLTSLVRRCFVPQQSQREHQAFGPHPRPSAPLSSGLVLRPTTLLRLRLSDLLYGYRGLLVLSPPFSSGMSSSKASVLPTAIRHSTLFSSSTRYRCHKLLALAIIALLALAVPPANAVDIPPRHRQYKYTRTLAHENVKREPAAHLHQAFGVVSIHVAVGL